MHRIDPVMRQESSLEFDPGGGLAVFERENLEPDPAYRGIECQVGRTIIRMPGGFKVGQFTERVGAVARAHQLLCVFRQRVL